MAEAASLMGRVADQRRRPLAPRDTVAADPNAGRKETGKEPKAPNRYLEGDDASQRPRTPSDSRA